MAVVLPPTAGGIAQAALWLREGRLVAFGTETVYGLGARADSAAAVAAVYAAKRRRADNPLICHYADVAAVDADVEVGPLARQIAARFWPGPLSMVLPRRVQSRIAAAVAPAGPVAVRVPGHPVTLALLEQAGVPIAAPSANVSGRISPTCAADVLEGLGDVIDAVLDTGPCSVGIESSVIDLSCAPPALLRSGGIGRAELEAVMGLLDRGQGRGALHAPGQLAGHYAPILPVRLDARRRGPGEALLAFGPPLDTLWPWFQLSAGGDLGEAAARLFGGLRLLDREGVARGLCGIAVMPIPSEGLGEAINDRLARAAWRAPSVAAGGVGSGPQGEPMA